MWSRAATALVAVTLLFNATVWAAPVEEALHVDEECRPGDEECAVGLLQKRSARPSANRTELMEIGASEAMRLGQFEELTTNLEDGACYVEGVWHGAESPRVRFMAQKNKISLGVGNLPTVLLQYHDDQELATVEMGGTLGSTHQEIDTSTTLQEGFDKILKSSVAFGSGKQISSLLGKHGLDGKAAPCTRKLHLFLLTLSKAATAQEWGSYGFDAECPAQGATTWECRQEGIWWGMSDGPWYPGGDSRMFDGYQGHKHDIKCRPKNPKTWQDKECVGLCGATCDCWDSICGDSYMCDYNPTCCAHDYACSKQAGGGTLTAKCINAADVYKACQ